MKISFDSIDFFSLVDKLETVNTVSNQLEKQGYVLTFDAMKGIEGVLIQLENSTDVSFKFTPNTSLGNERPNILLCIFSGNKPIDISTGGVILNNRKELLVAFAETQYFEANVPPQFRGCMCFFLISETWQDQYTKLAQLQLPLSRSYLGFVSQEFSIIRDLKKIDRLKALFFMSKLLLACIEELNIHNSEEDIDTHRIIRISAYLLENLSHQQPPLSELAHLATMSISSLKVKFKQYHGKTIKDFFVDEKMKYARSLLEQGNRVKEVAVLLGYKAPQSFSNAFKRVHGVSPSDFDNIQNNTNQ